MRESLPISKRKNLQRVDATGWRSAKLISRRRLKGLDTRLDSGSIARHYVFLEVGYEIESAARDARQVRRSLAHRILAIWIEC
jgi:hypothetical protein